jgi:hypothetical protein
MVSGNAGKGDKYRKVDYEKYSRNWDMIFNKKKENKNGTDRRKDSKPKKRS